MVDISKFLQVMSGRFRKAPLSRVDRFQARLVKINDQLEELKARHAAAAPDERPLFNRYLMVLDKKCVEIDEQLCELEPGSEVDVELVQHELKEARQRLRIAKQAAKAPSLH